jgi:hypothetical protein
VTPPNPGKLLLQIAADKFEGILCNAINNKCLTDVQISKLSFTISSAILGQDNSFTVLYSNGRI